MITTEIEEFLLVGLQSRDKLMDLLTISCFFVLIGSHLTIGGVCRWVARGRMRNAW